MGQNQKKKEEISLRRNVMRRIEARDEDEVSKSPKGLFRNQRRGVAIDNDPLVPNHKQHDACKWTRERETEEDVQVLLLHAIAHFGSIFS